MKPAGITWDMRLTPNDRVADAIWSAVEAAQSADWTAEKFKREVAEAWAYHVKERLAHDLKTLGS